MAFSSNSSQFSVTSDLNVSGLATFSNNVVIQKQLLANGVSGTAGQVLLSAGSGNTYWGDTVGGSSFVNWQINGSQTLTTVGSDTLNIIAGNNIILAASNTSTKSITISANVEGANTGVTAGTYGNTTVVPVITIDAKGRITSATTNTISGGGGGSSVTGLTYTNANTTITVSTSGGNYSANIETGLNQAYANAIAYSGNAALAYANAIAYSGNAALAYSNAISYAATIAGTAYSNAVTYTNSLAATAYSNAVSTASGDATTKAATAYSNATSYADTKAATAYSNATSYADTKAAAAYSNAVAYAASNSYVNSTFALKSGPSFSGTSSFTDVTISGNLTVSGTTTYINTTNLNVGDNIITLNADLGAIAPSENAGIEINRGTSANVVLRWNETSDIWQTTTDGSTYATIATNNDVTTAYSNATSYASNASNISSGTVAFARLPSLYIGTTSIQSTSASQALSGITTFAAGNTTITGFANVSSTLQTSSLGVGTAASGIAGEIRATNEITAYYSSDERLKNNIKTIDSALYKLKKIRGVMFDWSDEVIEQRGGEDKYFVRKHDTGVIAQEVEQVLPEVVAVRKDGYKAVRYEKLAGLIIQAVNELADEVEEIKQRLK